MNKKEIAEFFDRCAPSWDANQVIDAEIINIILDNASVSSGKAVLDVACGTGVMVPFYLERKVKKITGIDISPKMTEIARSKFETGGVSFITADAEEELPEGEFDVIVVYNAFPHFPNPEKLIKNLSSALKTGGVLTVAHGMSREAIDRHHSTGAKNVSVGLLEAPVLAEMFSEYLKVTKTVSNDRMYQVVGIKEEITL